MVSKNPIQIKAAALAEYSSASLSQKSAGQFEISYPGTKSKIAIGDCAKTANFKPDLEISHWDGEVSFKLIAPVHVNSKEQLSSALSADKVTASNGDWQFEYKTTEPKEGFNEFGGLDMIITAKSKPSSNRIEFTYDSSTVTPYPQPPLTEKWEVGKLEDGTTISLVSETDVYDDKGNIIRHRPDYVVGSIAFYANIKKNYIIGEVNYANGKISHLYAMKCQGQWCRWTVEGDLIVLTIPQEVIDKGTYPLTIAPVGDTFGYTTTPTSSYWTMATNTAIYGAYPCLSGVAGIASSISIYIMTTSIKNMLFAIYTNGATSNLIANSPTGEVASAASSWCTANTGAATITANTEYDIAIQVSGSYIRPGYDDAAGYYESVYSSGTYGTWPSSITWSFRPNVSNQRLGIYVTYTAAGGEEYSATATVALGLVVSATRATTLARTSTRAIGAVVSATRNAVHYRLSSRAAGLVPTATRSRWRGQTASVALGLIPTATRLLTGARTSTRAIGLIPTATRLLTASRTATRAAGLIPTATRATQILRTATRPLGLAITALRQTVMNRTSTVSAGLVTTASRITEHTRTASTAIGLIVSATVQQIGIYFFTATVALGLVPTASRVITVSRSATTALGLVVSATVKLGGSILNKLIALGIIGLNRIKNREGDL